MCSWTQRRVTAGGDARWRSHKNMKIKSDGIGATTNWAPQVNTKQYQVCWSIAVNFRQSLQLVAAVQHAQSQTMKRFQIPLSRVERFIVGQLNRYRVLNEMSKFIDLWKYILLRYCISQMSMEEVYAASFLEMLCVSPEQMLAKGWRRFPNWVVREESTVQLQRWLLSLVIYTALDRNTISPLSIYKIPIIYLSNEFKLLRCSYSQESAPRKLSQSEDKGMLE